MEDMKGVVTERLAGPFQCLGHCREEATLKFLDAKSGLLGAVVCPSGYVSRLISYGPVADPGGLRSFVSAKTGGALPVREGDIRVATRYAADLGLGGRGRILGEAYWTQNYGKGKSQDPGRAALFLCSSCGELFVQPASAKSSLCDRCAP
jgi:hypothetical protein